MKLAYNKIKIVHWNGLIPKHFDHLSIEEFEVQRFGTGFNLTISIMYQ